MTQRITKWISKGLFVLLLLYIMPLQAQIKEDYYYISNNTDTILDVLSNDSSFTSGHALSGFSIVSTPFSGTAVVGTTEIEYTALSTSFEGKDSFSYRFYDSVLAEYDTAMVFIVVYNPFIHTLSGDANTDGRVNQYDLLFLGARFQKTNPIIDINYRVNSYTDYTMAYEWIRYNRYSDLNYDDIVNNLDYTILNTNYGNRLSGLSDSIYVSEASSKRIQTTSQFDTAFGAIELNDTIHSYISLQDTATAEIVSGYAGRIESNFTSLFSNAIISYQNQFSFPNFIQMYKDTPNIDFAISKINGAPDVDTGILFDMAIVITDVVIGELFNKPDRNLRLCLKNFYAYKLVGNDFIKVPVNYGDSCSMSNYRVLSLKDIKDKDKVGVYYFNDMNNIGIKCNYDRIEDIEIYSMDGKLNKRIQVQDYDYLLEPSTFASGLYVMKVNFRNDSYFTKIVVK